MWELLYANEKGVSVKLLQLYEVFHASTQYACNEEGITVVERSCCRVVKKLFKSKRGTVSFMAGSWPLRMYKAT